MLCALAYKSSICWNVIWVANPEMCNSFAEITKLHDSDSTALNNDSVALTHLIFLACTDMLKGSNIPESHDPTPWITILTTTPEYTNRSFKKIPVKEL